MAENFLHFMASQAERRIAQAQKDGAEKVRQMQKLDVILMRMNSRRERSVVLTEHDPYYENVVRRISLLKKRPE